MSFNIKEIFQNINIVYKTKKSGSPYKSIKKISRILLVLSFILFVYIALFNPKYYYIELLPVIKTSIIIGMIPLAIYIAFIITKFKDTSKFYKLLLIPSISILIFSLFTSYISLYLGNIMLDKSPIIKKSFVIFEKTEQSRKHGHRHIFSLNDEHNYLKDIEISVSSKKYKSAEVYDTLQLNIKEGYFGFKWIESTVVQKRALIR